MLSRMQFMCLSNAVYCLYLQRFGRYSKCRHECSCSSTRRVSNFNTNVPLGDIYPPIELHCNVLGIDNAMPL